MILARIASLALLASLGARDAEDSFTVRNVDLPGGAATQTVVSADRRAVTTFDALHDLTQTMNWNLQVESRKLEEGLRSFTVDLDLKDQDPRMVGQLLAVAAGADTSFDAGEPGVGRRPTLHVMRKPGPETGSGRNRLRQLAAQWYRSFLGDELRHEPLVNEEAARVRMELGQLMFDRGEFEEAIQEFFKVHDERSIPYAPTALLRMAQAQVELANFTTDRDRARDHARRAVVWAETLLRDFAHSPEATGATVALGRALLREAAVAEDAEASMLVYDRCRKALWARVMKLRDTVEMLDVWLLMGEAAFHLEQPSDVYESMLTLRESPNFEDLSDRQFRDYHFLLGYASLGLGKFDLAMRSLEWFLIHCEGDSRRRLANLMLAEAYLELGSFLEAQAAGIEAGINQRPALWVGGSARWQSRASLLWARILLAVGHKEEAFLDLESLERAGGKPDPQLVLFLVDQLLVDDQWQRAVAAARVLFDGGDEFADLARFKTVQALYEQSVASKSFADFPVRARELAVEVNDANLQRKCAEMIGDAYSAMGRREAAADAYRGFLR